MIFEKLIILILSIYFFINFLILFLLFLHLFFMISKIPLKLISKNLKTNNVFISKKKILKYEYLNKGNFIKEILI